MVVILIKIKVTIIFFIIIRTENERLVLFNLWFFLALALKALWQTLPLCLFKIHFFFSFSLTESQIYLEQEIS